MNRLRSSYAQAKCLQTMCFQGSSSPPRIVGSLSPIGAALTNSNKPPLPKSVQKLIEFLKKEQQVLNLIAFNLLKRHYSID